MAEDASPADTIVRECEVCLKVKTTMFYRNKDYIADKIVSQVGQHFESKFTSFIFISYLFFTPLNTRNIFTLFAGLYRQLLSWYYCRGVGNSNLQLQL